jgi:hypothetical protein
MEAVRRALDELGPGAKSQDLQGFVKSRFGFDMTLGHVKNAKGKILRQARAGGKAGANKKPARKPAATKSAARKTGTKVQAPTQSGALPSPTGLAKGSGKESGIPLNDILYVKELVERFGQGQLHTLVDAFGQ